MTKRKIAIFVLGPSALATAHKMKSSVGGLIHGPEGLDGCDQHFEKATRAINKTFLAGSAIIGICASGILIRAVANLLQHKSTDSPVVAVAEDCSCAVPLIGGHHGANELAMKIANAPGAIAALTTASDVALGDTGEAEPDSVVANPQDYKAATAARLRGEDVRIETTIHAGQGGPAHLLYHPKLLTVGIGCERGTSPDEVITLLGEVLRQHNLAPAAIATYGSIDLKEDEPALTQFANPIFFSAEQLRSFAGQVPNPSTIVENEVGTASVAEAAALALAGDGAELIVQKTKGKRATVAVAKAVTPGSIWLHEGRTRGTVSLLGIGPGDRLNRSNAVVDELWNATDWVGYSLYLDLINDLRTDQIRHDFPLGDEEKRCRHAIELAKHGKRVALVCSGDAGIYAMAALVHELIDREPCRIAVEVHPGISAFQMASARVGAMIGHDFCCISLSDLLTPWETIVQRIVAAAEGDFVVSFYNPRSLKRTDQIVKAFEILKPHRRSDTPVVLASNLGRPKEKVRILRFDEFRAEDVDMLTLVMVGSSQSRAFKRGDGKTYAYTPRGYAKKMEPL